ncbi:NAD(P)-dependent oxidoreductase [Streptomyces sp. FXJ1.4098]|nr:NAD(P)-dependent oxidoreductase [Streptomyces sp. FXJ1.4098]
MKSTATLVNTSRGGIVDEDALLQAVRDRVIHSAALDVFEREPMGPNCHRWSANPM